MLFWIILEQNLFWSWIFKKSFLNDFWPIFSFNGSFGFDGKSRGDRLSILGIVNFSFEKILQERKEINVKNSQNTTIYQSIKKSR